MGRPMQRLPPCMACPGWPKQSPDLYILPSSETTAQLIIYGHSYGVVDESMVASGCALSTPGSFRAVLCYCRFQCRSSPRNPMVTQSRAIQWSAACVTIPWQIQAPRVPPPGLTGRSSWGAGQPSWSMRSTVPQYRPFGGMMMQDGETTQPAVYYGAAEPLQSYQNGGSLEQKGVQHHAWPVVA